MKNAHGNHVKMAFSTDADYYIPGMTRGQVSISCLIALRENPLENIDTLRDVRSVMKDGLFFKRDGVVMPEKWRRQ